MPRLVPPSTDVHASFLAAMAEFRAEGRGAPDDASAIGRDLRAHGDAWRDPAVFARHVAALRADALPETPRPEGFVPSTTLWYVEGEEFLGRLDIRHELNDWLLERGGHIGYDVRPAARRRGHATAMLRAALPVAASLGIDRALVTCDVGNEPSRRVIQACGGVYEDTRKGKLRHWIPTAG
ncbi:GNAT family N-acetyltransferase [Actinomadura parmotrematis]|uniref:GNAT family N-acetyltransferase n=1 Tax=Actinomadura parmotrematis TaxID=2864039 RepID=A0ABS7FRP9_9ACTN|nr:GNAT family N-acetyltransferase [Actinomadura parmotrematis]MBW8483077.1 GNAT family N-acetyltransferase [Actinomadura parmotrematis]